MSAHVLTLRLQNLIQLTVSHIALNPAITGSLLWILLKGPAHIREHLVSRIAALRDPKRLQQIVKALKTLLVLGLLGSANRRLNERALNSGRWTAEKNKWNFGHEGGEIAVVTGGCSGIGELIVRGLVKKEVRVVVLDIQELPLPLQGKPLISFFKCDITNLSAVLSTADSIRTTIGTPSILVNNAGIAQCHSILNTPEDYLRKLFDVNLLSNWWTVKAFLPDMCKANKGHVVTVASTASYIGVAGMADYTSSKAGVLAFHESLNQELKLHYKAPGILTTSIHPNWVRTPLIQPFEKELDAGGAPIIEPQVVADAVVKQIAGARGGQVYLPKSVGAVSLLRGLPNWVQEGFRATTSRAVLGSVK